MSWWSIKQTVFRRSVAVSNFVFGKEASHRNSLVRELLQCRNALSEKLSPARRKQARFERENPDAPWLVPQSIPVIARILTPQSIGFEWGAGRSTLWFARRVRHITSVEGRRDWLEEVSRMVAQAGLSEKVSLRLCEVTSEHGFLESEIARYAGAIDDIADGSLDFILIDGHFRDACTRKAARKVRPGGHIIIDNTEAMTASLIDEMPVAEKQSWNNGIWETTLVRFKKEHS